MRLKSPAFREKRFGGLGLQLYIIPFGTAVLQIQIMNVDIKTTNQMFRLKFAMYYGPKQLMRELFFFFPAITLTPFVDKN